MTGHAQVLWYVHFHLGRAALIMCYNDCLQREHYLWKLK